MSTSNHLSSACADKNLPGLHIWLFHDHRAGHLKQLQGLADRLSAHAQLHCIWLDIQHYRLTLRHVWRRPKTFADFPTPQIIIGAGHATHLSVLLAARHFNALSVVVMKPSLPLCCFDAVICPAHDEVQPSHRILTTCGPLNRIRPPARDAQRNQHLILLGGPSKHYQFDAEKICSQIQQLCLEQTTTNWLLSTSPRTSEHTLSRLKAMKLPNLSLFDYRDPTLPPLETLLVEANRVWLTPDSMAMIFEALTAGAKVGVFEDTPRADRDSRIIREIQRLKESKQVLCFADRSVADSDETESPLLWETDRAARWLLTRLADNREKGS